MIKRNHTSVPAATMRHNPKVSRRILKEPAPKLPHERDESVDSQVTEPRKIIQNAAADLSRGQQDTDRSAEMNKVYRKLKQSADA